MLKSVFVVTIIGGVAGQCGGRIPLNGRLGVRLFCGVGENSVPCPAGSLCELPAGFCCPVATVTPVTLPNAITPINLVAKCPRGSPWKNALGVEFDCGPGLNHADCPVGSECIVGLNDVFHACCALPGVTMPPMTTSGSVSIAGSVGTTSGRPMSTDTTGTKSTTTKPSDMWTGTKSTDTTTKPTDSTSTGTKSTDTMSTGTKSTDTTSKTTDTMSTEMSMESEENATETTDSIVRYLSIRLLDPTQAIAMWAPPNGTTPHSYIAEISYDGTEWRKLNLEEPDSTFITFTVTEKKDFHIRVTPEGGSPLEEFFSFQKKGKGKSGKAEAQFGTSEGKSGKAEAQFGTSEGKSGKAEAQSGKAGNQQP